MKQCGSDPPSRKFVLFQDAHKGLSIKGLSIIILHTLERLVYFPKLFCGPYKQCLVLTKFVLLTNVLPSPNQLNYHVCVGKSNTILVGGCQVLFSLAVFFLVSCFKLYRWKCFFIVLHDSTF